MAIDFNGGMNNPFFSQDETTTCLSQMRHTIVNRISIKSPQAF